MNKFGNELSIQQGEAFSLDLPVMGNDTQPFIISSRMSNPYFVVTIVSSKYEKELRYSFAYWQDLKYIPKFYGTNIIELSDKPTSSNDLRHISSVIGGRDTIEGSEIHNYLYHYDNTYYYNKYDTNGFATLMEDYELRLNVDFGTDITGDLSSQNYTYQVSLVTGISMSDKCNAWSGEKPDEWSNMNNVEKYNYIKLKDKSYFTIDIDSGSPLGEIINVVTILPPTKLTVSNNNRKLI